eukprot:COSAG01_NODE_11001_length_2030_cov_1.310202_1_plen_431_part_10
MTAGAVPATFSFANFSAPTVPHSPRVRSQSNHTFQAHRKRTEQQPAAAGRDGEAVATGMSEGDKVAAGLPPGSGRFCLAREVTRAGRPCSAEVRRRMMGSGPDRVAKAQSFETGGIGFFSGSKRFRRSVFPELDGTDLHFASWATNTHLEPGISEPDVRRFEEGPLNQMHVAAERSARSYTSIRRSNVPRLILDKILQACETEPHVGPGTYHPRPGAFPRVRVAPHRQLSSLKSAVPRMGRSPQPPGDGTARLNNYEHTWDRKEWLRTNAGSLVLQAERLADAQEVVRTCGQIPQPGERGWGVPERNIPGVTVGVYPMSDETPNHIYDHNDPFGQWTLVEQSASSIRQYASAFKSKAPRFMESLDRTPRTDSDGGREVSAVTYGSSWYASIAGEHTPSPHLGPAATGGSQLLALRREAQGRVDDILVGCQE